MSVLTGIENGVFDTLLVRDPATNQLVDVASGLSNSYDDTALSSSIAANSATIAANTTALGAKQDNLVQISLGSQVGLLQGTHVLKPIRAGSSRLTITDSSTEVVLDAVDQTITSATAPIVLDATTNSLSFDATTTGTELAVNALRVTQHVVCTELEASYMTGGVAIQTQTNIDNSIAPIATRVTALENATPAQMTASAPLSVTGSAISLDQQAFGAVKAQTLRVTGDSVVEDINADSLSGPAATAITSEITTAVATREPSFTVDASLSKAVVNNVPQLAISAATEGRIATLEANSSATLATQVANLQTAVNTATTARGIMQGDISGLQTRCTALEATGERMFCGGKIDGSTLNILHSFGAATFTVARAGGHSQGVFSITFGSSHPDSAHYVISLTAEHSANIKVWETTIFLPLEASTS